MEVQEKSPPPNIQRVAVPNSQGVLILGIFSLVTTVCCGGIGFVGLILGIVAVAMSAKAIQSYEQNPNAYLEGSFKNINAGRICGIIGICLNGLIILAGIIYLLIVGASLATVLSGLPWEDIIN